MSTIAFISGMLILGICVIVAALLLSGAINGAASALKESSPQAMQQPTLTFLTEYDAADYLGVSLNELDYIRSEGLLEGSFVAVTSLEQTGEEQYFDVVDGVEIAKMRPVMSNVTRFLFNRSLLDEKMMEAIKNGKHINPVKGMMNQKKHGGKNAPDAPSKTVPINAEKPEKPFVGTATIEYTDEPADEKKPAEQHKSEQKPIDAPTSQKPADQRQNSQKKPSGPKFPAAPIGEDISADEDAEDVIDIMSRLNAPKNPQNSANRPGGGSKQGGNRQGGNRPGGNRPGSSGQNQNRQNGNRPGGKD